MMLQKLTVSAAIFWYLAFSKAGHRSNLASLRFRVNAATERRKHTQVDFLWITQRFRTIAVFPINWERLDASVFTTITSMLPAIKRKSRTFATRETDVIFERKHCSRRRRHTQVELSSSRKCADKTQTITRKRWHGARKRKRSNVRSTCGRLYGPIGLYRENAIAVRVIDRSAYDATSRVHAHRQRKNLSYLRNGCCIYYLRPPGSAHL